MPNTEWKQYWDKDWLYDQHVNQKKTIRQIADELDVNPKTVSYFKYKHKIKTPREVRYSGVSKYTCNFNYFKEIDSEHKAYWLGYILADGGIEKMNCNSKRLNFCIQRSDSPHLEKFKDAIESSHPISFGSTSITTHGTYENATLRIASTELCDSLMTHNILPNKSMVEKMPTAVPPELMKHFWRGVIDGDGSISGQKITQLHLIGSSEVLLAFRDFSKSISPKIRAKTRISGRNTVFCISGTNALKVIHELYSDSNIHLDRKYQVAQAHLLQKI